MRKRPSGLWNICKEAEEEGEGEMAEEEDEKEEDASRVSSCGGSSSKLSSICSLDNDGNDDVTSICGN